MPRTLKRHRAKSHSQVVVSNWHNTKSLKKKKHTKHEQIVENWHCDGKIPESREYKLLFGLAEEDDFNDLFVDSFVTEEPDLLCFKI